MNTTLIIILVVVVVVLAVALFIVRMLWIRKQNEKFYRLFKLMPSGKYNGPVFTGIYRRYQLTIAPFLDERKKNKHTLTKVAIKMNNPNKRFFIISKSGKVELPSFLPFNHLEGVAIQTMPATVDSLTNDVMMCNVIFTEDIKRQIEERMREISVGAIYLVGEELGVVSTTFTGKKETYELWGKQMELICDIKDAFQ
jgi:hypothetical protein